MRTETLISTQGNEIKIEVNCSTCRQLSVAKCELCQEGGLFVEWVKPDPCDPKYVEPALIPEGGDNV